MNFNKINTLACQRKTIEIKYKGKNPSLFIDTSSIFMQRNLPERKQIPFGDF